MALQLIDVTPGAGDTAPVGGAKINSNFTELFNIHVVNPRMLRVEMDGDDDTGEVGSGKPFATLSAAMDAADELSETVEGAEIYIGAGEYEEDSNVTIASEYVSIIGGSIRNTRVSFTAGTLISIESPNFYAGNLALIRSGSNVGAVISANVTSLATYIEGIRMDNVRVVNASGTAIGTCAGVLRGCEASGMIAVDWAYGSQHYNCEYIAHDPALEETTYCVKTAQTCAAWGGAAAYYPDESDKRRKTRFLSCRFINTDPNGVGVNGVTEDDVGNRLTKDWYYQLQQDVPGNGGQPYVSWFPVPLIGCDILGPQPRVGAGSDNEGVIVRTTGTGGALRGTLRVIGCEIYGFYLLDYVHDSDFVGGMIVPDSASHQVIDSLASTSFTGTSFILGRNRLGATDGQPIVHLGSGNHFTNCHFQGETQEVFRGNQYQIINSDQIGFDQRSGGIGYNDVRSKAARFMGAATCYFKTVVTADYTLATGTFECWFRCDGTLDDSRLFSHDTAGGLTTIVVNTTGDDQIYAYADGVLLANITTGITIGNSAWHHAAITITGGTGELWLDGVSQGSNTGVSMSGTSAFRIGIADGNTAFFKGDITEVRISSTARYSGAFTPRDHFMPDSNTLSLWSDSTRDPLIWTDQMRLHDAPIGLGDGTDIYNAPNIPYWVERDAALAYY